MPQPLSHDEVRNTVQSLIGPSFKVIVSRSEAEYISKLTGQRLERGLLQSVLYNLTIHGAHKEKIEFWRKRIAEIDKDLAAKEKSKNDEMKYKYSWDETDKDLWDKPEDCKICKDGWVIDYNGVSKYPCNYVKGQEKKNKVIEFNKLTYNNNNNNNVVPIDSYTYKKYYKKYYEQEQVNNSNWPIAAGSLGSAGASTAITQDKEKHEHLHEAIKIAPEPKGRRFRKPVSP